MTRIGQLLALQLVACVLAVLFSKASAVYNWANIGGGVDAHFEQWYAAMGPLSILSLLSWLASVVAAIFLTKGMSRLSRLTWTISCLAAPPICGWAADHLFHRGFPQISS